MIESFFAKPLQTKRGNDSLPEIVSASEAPKSNPARQTMDSSFNMRQTQFSPEPSIRPEKLDLWKLIINEEASKHQTETM